MQLSPYQDESSSRHPTSPVSSELALLNFFLGYWHMEGPYYAYHPFKDNDSKEHVKWVSSESFQWMAGGYFLEHRIHASIGKAIYKALGIIGYDTELHQYYAHYYDSEGHSQEYRLEPRGEQWIFSGPGYRGTCNMDKVNGRITLRAERQLLHDEWTLFYDLKGEVIQHRK